MKRFVSLLALAFCLTAGMAQTYKMVVRVNNGTAMGFPDGKIAIPVDNISEVTFEEISEDVIPEGTTPVTFQFKDYTATTRSPMRKAPALTARKYGVFGCYKNGEPVSPYLFIPTDGETEITITVNYFVTTDDAYLTNGYSRVKNVISKPLNLNFNAGYNYDLKIIFGLTSVKCDVSTSSSWENNDIIF